MPYNLQAVDRILHTHLLYRVKKPTFTAQVQDSRYNFFFQEIGI